MKTLFALAMATAATCVLASDRFSSQAHACGGCFHEPSPSQNVSDITDERMLLAVSPNQTTLYDQIRYEGSPSKFAWVLPIKGTVTIGLSADVLFDAVDALTATKITAPPPVCPSCGRGGGGVGCGSSEDSLALSASGGGREEPPVTVTKQENVGPYETVQIHAANGSGTALNQWLSDNGFEIPSDATITIDGYASEGFDFLAMKLLPNQGIQAMRPVRVTSSGAGFSLPLRMAAVGTGATVGITLWVFATGRYEPQNFPFFRIEDADLVWDYQVSSSNYTTLRAQHEADQQNRAWEIEQLLSLNTQIVSQAIVTGGASVTTGTGTPATADDDYAPIDGANATFGDGGVLLDAGTLGESADEVRYDDIQTLLDSAGGSSVVRVTRMRTDIAHAAMGVDLALQASADQSELSNQRYVSTTKNGPKCQSCDDGGCDASAVRPENRASFAVTLFALVGLVLTRVVRFRRRR